MGTPIRILLVDDHTLVRSGLRLLLEKDHDIEVVGEAANAADAICIVEQMCPDIVLMDITLPDSDGISATRRILHQCPQTRVIALTMHAEDAYLIKFLETGGVGYIRKSAADRDLIRAIQAVMKGEIFLQPEGIQLMARRYRTSPYSAEAQQGPEILSDREREVMVWVAKGYTCREIGEQLALSPRTVETYRQRIMEKLNLKHRSEMVEFALRHHLIEA